MFGALKWSLAPGVCGLLALAFLAAPGAAAAPTNGAITHVKVNGQFASAILFDPAGTGTNGGMTVSRVRSPIHRRSTSPGRRRIRRRRTRSF